MFQRIILWFRRESGYKEQLQGEMSEQTFSALKDGFNDGTDRFFRWLEGGEDGQEDFYSWHISQLRSYAKDRNIEFSRSDTKPQLIERIKNNNKHLTHAE